MCPTEKMLAELLSSLSAMSADQQRRLNKVSLKRNTPRGAYVLSGERVRSGVAGT